MPRAQSGRTLALFGVLTALTSCGGRTFDSGSSGPVDTSDGASDASTMLSDADEASQGDTSVGLDGTVSTDGSGTVPSASDCAPWAAAVCASYQQCKPSYIATEFGDVATCAAEYAILCLAKGESPGSGLTVAWLARCATALGDPGLSCDTFLNEGPPTCATPAGSLPAGASCLYDEQCGGEGACGVPLGGSQCDGTCGTLGCTALGECPTGQVCDSVQMFQNACEPPIGVGGTCCDGCTFNGSTCRDGLDCLGETLSDPKGSCETPLEAGASCVPPSYGSDSCDHNHGYACSPSLATCVAVQYADGGSACDGVVKQCRAGECDNSTCLAWLREGQGPGKGVGALASCMFPLVENASGVCVAPSMPTLCGLDGG
jgi:hypothetical protein